MKSVNYSRYVGEDWDSLSLEELLHKLSDFLLQSGFDDPYLEEFRDSDRDLQDLHQAILQALTQGEMETDEFQDDSEVAQLIRHLVRKLEKEGYIRTRRGEKPAAGMGARSQLKEGAVRFELTDKTIDFLGYKTLKNLLGSLGKSSFGRHDTRDLSTGVELTGATKPYQFGDTLNLDASGTILNSIRRAGLKNPVEIDYPDLEIHQSEYQSSCATVMMLDCSHSMILYGEDRFTPAKKVALALSHLIRTQYPGDTLHVVLFHDSAEEIPLGRLARVRVGPFYTNTCEGLRLAQRILARESKDMRQIIMITDGKPSAVTEPDGTIYRNAFGLDPYVVGATFKEVSQCRRSNILINTFMLAHDADLVAFVRKVTEVCRGKAYFTTPHSLGKYILMDYMRRKVQRVH
ncbi:MAG: VWA domain-containing protein [Acidobacteria bacterium]|nr:VWA domain-containing protein [Acidobacteriota bacterium]